MYSILQTTFQKEEPKILIYRYFKKFTYTDFQSELVNKPSSHNSYEYCAFEKRFVEVLDTHAPKKGKSFVVTTNLMLIKHYILQL